MKEDQYESERQITESFLKAHSNCQFKLFKPKTDPPDVLVEIDNQIIGIEVTSRISSISQIRIEKEFQQIFDTVKENLSKAEVNNIVVRVEPNETTKINRNKCIDIITNSCVQNFDNIGLHRTEIAENPIPEISKIVAFRTLENEVIVSFDSRRKIFGHLTESTLQEIIRSKIIKLNNLKKSSILLTTVA